MASAEEILNHLKRGNSLRTWEVHHTALATAIAKGLVSVTADCLIEQPSDSETNVDVSFIKQPA